jgi:hypothetical protein
MKIHLLALIAFSVVATQSLQAGENVVPMGNSNAGFDMIRSGGNMYRISPQNMRDPENQRRYRSTYFKPTQHYYVRDNVISYRYSEDVSSRPGSTGNSYLGPRGGVFEPSLEQITSPSSIRNYAATHRRYQPGVGMVRSTRTADIETPRKAETRIVSATR